MLGTARIWTVRASVLDDLPMHIAGSRRKPTRREKPLLPPMPPAAVPPTRPSESPEARHSTMYWLIGSGVVVIAVVIGLAVGLSGGGHSLSYKIGYSAGDDRQLVQTSITEGGQAPSSLCSQLNSLAQSSANGSNTSFNSEYATVPADYSPSDFMSGCLDGVNAAGG